MMYVLDSSSWSKITRSMDVPAADPEVSCGYRGVPGNLPRKIRHLAHLGDALLLLLRVMSDRCVTGAGVSPSPAPLKKGASGDKDRSVVDFCSLSLAPCMRSEPGPGGEASRSSIPGEQRQDRLRQQSGRRGRRDLHHKPHRWHGRPDQLHQLQQASCLVPRREQDRVRQYG